MWDFTGLAGAVLDGLLDNVAVLDAGGTIRHVNRAWRQFALENGGGGIPRFGVGLNYLAVCDRVAGEDREFAARVRTEIAAVAAGTRDRFELEYPCHSPDERRWFLVRAGPLLMSEGEAPAGVVVAHLNITRRRLAEDAAEAHRERLRALASHVIGVEDRARARLASELHDRIAQSLALARMKLTSGEALSGAGESAVAAVSLIDQAMASTRSLMADLEPPVLKEFGLTAAVEELADEFHRRFGIEFSVEDDGRPKPLSHPVRSTLYRSVRELFTNAVKHASAGRVSVRLATAGQRLVVEVRDDGRGFDPTSTAPADGFGLLQLKERLVDLRGSLHLDAEPGRGTRVVLSVPLEEEPEAR